KGGRQDLRDQGLSRHAARFQRRLSAELPRRRGQGRLGADARLAQAIRRGVTSEPAPRPGRSGLKRLPFIKSGRSKRCLEVRFRSWTTASGLSLTISAKTAKALGRLGAF